MKIDHLLSELDDESMRYVGRLAQNQRHLLRERLDIRPENSQWSVVLIQDDGSLRVLHRAIPTQGIALNYAKDVAMALALKATWKGPNDNV